VELFGKKNGYIFSEVEMGFDQKTNRSLGSAICTVSSTYTKRPRKDRKLEKHSKDVEAASSETVESVDIMECIKALSNAECKGRLIRASLPGNIIYINRMYSNIYIYI